jgi:hypothetical protein
VPGLARPVSGPFGLCGRMLSLAAISAAPVSASKNPVPSRQVQRLISSFCRTGQAISIRTKDALKAARVRGVTLGNPNGAAALRKAGKERIEGCANGKYQATEFEGTPPGIVLRSIDFRKLR